MNKRAKIILKFVFVIAIIAIIIYTFRDSAGLILEELKKTSVKVVGIISLLAILYELVEGWITYSFAKQYNPSFTYWMGLESAFYCCFYRVATLGSGAGVAAIYYLNEKGIAVSKGTGMYMLEYVLHKVTIAIFSAIFFIMSWGFMRYHFGDYTGMLILAYVITVLIAVVMLLFCCSSKCHDIILWLVDKINRKGRFDAQEKELKKQCRMMEEATSHLLVNKRFVISVILKNLLKFSFWYSIPYFVLASDSNMTLLEAMAITSLSVMIAAVIPSPAGIGSTEFVFTLLFTAIVGTGNAGSLSLLYRFATFVLPFVIGMFIVISRKRVAKQIEKHRNHVSE